MKFNRIALIIACNKALARDRDQFDTRQAKAAKREAREVAAWRDRYAAAWDKAALRIRRELKAGNPITMDMIPISGYRNGAYFTPDPDVSRQYQEPKELVALRTVLETIADDTVTISALERLGIDRSTIKDAAQDLAPATISGVSA